MTSLIDYRANIEADFNWRLDELRFLKNVLSSLPDEDARAKYRRVLVVMLYAHAEGLVKRSLEEYCQAINEAALPVGALNAEIAACAIDAIFFCIESADAKHDWFKDTPPIKHKLNRHFRLTELWGRSDELKLLAAELNVGSIVDTEGNLNRVVVRKLLRKLGFKIEALDGCLNHLDELLGRRCSIAHGESSSSIREDDYSRLERATFDFMTAFVRLVSRHLHERAYLQLDHA